MAVNPDDLIIFRTRKSREKERAAAAAKPQEKKRQEASPATSAQTVPKPPSPPGGGIFGGIAKAAQTVQKRAEPQLQPPPAATPRPQLQEEPRGQAVSKPIKPAAGVAYPPTPKKEAAAPSPVSQAVKTERAVPSPPPQQAAQVGKAIAVQPQAQKAPQPIREVVKPPPAYTQQPAPSAPPLGIKEELPVSRPIHPPPEKAPGAYAPYAPMDINGVAAAEPSSEEPSTDNYLLKKETRTKKEAREAAKGKTCVWHPWRAAYAICSVCKRPFCYEDLVEEDNAFYCLEDVGRVPTTYKEKVTTSYNIVTLVSALLFMAQFMVFLFFANGQIANLFNTLYSSGAAGAINVVSTPQYAFLLGELLISLLGIPVALLLFVQSPRGYRFGIIEGFLLVVLFTNEYLTTALFYLGVVAAMAFLAILALVVSTSKYKTELSAIEYWYDYDHKSNTNLHGGTL